jgi:SSS family solute:Na+ symporter
VTAARLVTVLLFFCSSAVVYLLDTAKGAFDVILQVGAGTGLLYLVRWFWWRVNAWCEVVAMVSSFLVSIALLVAGRNGVEVSTHVALVLTVIITSICWIATAYIGPQTDRSVLIEFYRRVRPPGGGWRDIRREAGLVEEAASGDNIPLALLGWVAGCTTIWAALFFVGAILYGRMLQALIMGAVLIVGGLTLISVTRRLWAGTETARAADIYR